MLSTPCSGPKPEQFAEHAALAEAFAGLAAQIAAIDRSLAVIEFGLDGTILAANEHFLAALGYTLAELQGRHHRVLVDAQERESPEYRRFWERLGRGEYHSAEFKRIAKDGAEVWFQATYNPVLGPDGNAGKIIKLATNITANKMRAVEDAGRVDAISRSNAIIEFDMAGSVLTANDNYLAILGYDLAEIQGQPHGLFVDPAYRRSAAYAQFWEALRRGEFQAAEFRRIGKRGREIWLQASYNPIMDLRGAPYKVVKVATDITARKLAETRVAALQAEFQALLDCPPDARLRLFEGVVVQTTDAVVITEATRFNLPGPRIVYTNPAFTEMTGYSAEEVMGKSPRILQGPGTDPRTRERIRQALDHWHPLRVEMLNYKKDGTVFWAELNISPFRDDAGWYTHWISVQRDITERKRLEAELRQAAERLTLATESGGIGIWEMDIRSGAVSWDDRMRRLYDLDPAEPAMTYEGFLRCLHPDDREIARQALRETMAGNRRLDTQFRVVWRDGSVRHIRAIAEAERDAGAAQRILGVNWDVTQEVNDTLALQEVTTRMRLAADAGAIGILEFDLVRNVMVADAWASRIIGLKQPPGQPVPADVWRLCVHPEDRDRRDQARAAAIAGIAPYRLEYRVIRGIGEIRHLDCAAQITRDAQGRALRMTGTVQDITERKAIEAALAAAAAEAERLAGELKAEHQLLEVTLKSIGDAVVRTDMQGNITFTNGAAEALLNLPPGAAKRPPMAEIARMVEASRNAAPEAAGETVSLPADYTLLRQDGSRIGLEGCVAPIHQQEREAGKVIVFRDVTQARAIVHQTRHAATHDALTGLPNRLLLMDRIAQAIANAPRHGKLAAVLFLDLDGFKHINDSLGHAIGDQLLKSVSARLLACVRAADTVSRQGGDEFVVLLAELREPADAGITARRLLATVSETHFIDGQELHVSASIGVSLYPADGVDAATLLKAADTAMYKVKASGRHGYRFFEAGMEAAAIERQYIEENLRRAIKNKEFALHYQPKINLRSGAITGAEALIRWTHPDRGSISPGAFIPVAEECGLIRPLGAWVLREACEQGQLWRQAGLPPLTLSVNVSPSELGKGDFTGDVRAILQDTGFNPHYLELEMTEGVMMQRGAATEATFKALKEMGLRLAIDDFGTGYSSLSYLTKFPIDTLKIDQSFVRQISAEPAETAIVTAVIGMAHSLNLAVVAEGVETREELDFLAKLGCDEAQGYYFSRPVAAGSLTPLLAGEGKAAEKPHPSS